MGKRIVFGRSGEAYVRFVRGMHMLVLRAYTCSLRVVLDNPEANIFGQIICMKALQTKRNDKARIVSGSTVRT